MCRRATDAGVGVGVGDAGSHPVDACATCAIDASDERDGGCVEGRSCDVAACAALPAGAPSGTYRLRSATSTEWATYCEMEADGGGWTLVLKMDGNQPTFGYDSPLWTSDVLLNESSASLAVEEAKLAGFVSLPFTEARIVAAESDGESRSLVVPLRMTAPSLRDVFRGPAIPTSLGVAAWSSLMAAPLLEPNPVCEGFNQVGTSSLGYAVRLGLLANNEADCSTPDSRIGLGGRQDTTIARCGQPACLEQVGNTAGNAATCLVPACVDVRIFAYLFVR
jgi:hypothetical protein